MFPKATRVRSESYRRWVATLPCIACGIEGWTQVAHANYGKGMSMKVCDLLTFPACGPHWGMPGCHWQIDNTFQMTKEDRRELEARYVEATQAAAVEAGRAEFKVAA